MELWSPAWEIQRGGENVIYGELPGAYFIDMRGRRLSQRPRAKAHHLVREHAAPITLPRVSCLESEG